MFPCGPVGWAARLTRGIRDEARCPFSCWCRGGHHRAGARRHRLRRHGRPGRDEAVDRGRPGRAGRFRRGQPGRIERVRDGRPDGGLRRCHRGHALGERGHDGYRQQDRGQPGRVDRVRHRHQPWVRRQHGLRDSRLRLRHRGAAVDRQLSRPGNGERCGGRHRSEPGRVPGVRDRGEQQRDRQHDGLRDGGLRRQHRGTAMGGPLRRACRWARRCRRRRGQPGRIKGIHHRPQPGGERHLWLHHARLPGGHRSHGVDPALQPGKQRRHRCGSRAQPGRIHRLCHRREPQLPRAGRHHAGLRRCHRGAAVDGPVRRPGRHRQLPGGHDRRTERCQRVRHRPDQDEGGPVHLLDPGLPRRHRGQDLGADLRWAGRIRPACCRRGQPGRIESIRHRRHELEDP